MSLRRRGAGGAGPGLLLAIVSAASFGTSGTFGSALIHSGWTPGGAVLVRVALAAIVLAPVALLRLRGRWALLRHGWPAVTAFGVGAVGVAQVCYFMAVDRIPVGVALLFEYSGVVLVVLWMWLRHGHRPGAITLAGAVAALGGLVLVLDLNGVTSLDPIGVLWGLGAALGLASYFVLSAATEDALPPLVMAWGGLAVGAVALALLGAVGALPLTFTVDDVVLAGHRVSWLVPVAGLSLLAAVVAYVSGIEAARLLGARLASFVGLAEVLAAVSFAWLLLGEVPTRMQFAGGLLVLTGVVLVRIGEWHSALPAAEPPVAPAGEAGAVVAPARLGQ